jgi:hypothetical protein
VTHTGRTALSVVASLGLIASAAAARSPRDARQEVEAFLRYAKFPAADISQFGTGTVVARVDEGQNETEVLAVAAVKIRAPRDRVLAYYGQMVTYVDGQVTLGFNRFSSPPTLGDVKNLAFDPDEISELKSCRPGRCDIRLSGAALETLRSRINWNAPDAADQVNQFARQTAVGYVAAYLARGDGALVTYNDRAQPVNLRDQWAALLAGSPYFHQYAPELKTYLEQFPAGTLPGAESAIYWIKENFGMKPVISIVHAVIYRPPAQPDRVTVVQKQIYASHYYDGSLGVAALLDATEGGAPATYLVYANRSRGDLLQGGFGGLRRSVARSQARKAAADTLATIKRVMEGG